MLGRLFDSPWHLVILIVVVLVLFGANRLPDAARGLGRSLRIFKSEMREMKNDAPTRESEAREVEAAPPRDADAGDQGGGTPRNSTTPRTTRDT